MRRGRTAKAPARTRVAMTARAARISATLARLYPEARISLDFATAWQCLAATILSAQCTDERVNRVTPELFREIPDARAMAVAPLEKIERLILTTGFFRQKAKSLQGCARQVVERFGGEVPRTMEELVTLPGVGRKTANVVRGHVFGEPGLVVDTHVRRLSRRLGLTLSAEPDKIEIDLQKLRPPVDWTPFSMRLILHGRRVCFARRPNCAGCALLGDCPQIGVAAAAKRASAAD
ncbi:MAG: endonuclease III [Candidatus Binataceae bacterium]